MTCEGLEKLQKKIIIGHLLLILFLLPSVSRSKANVSEKIQTLTETLQKEPNNILASFNLAVLYHKEKKYKSAAKYYKKVISSPSPLALVANYYMAKIFVAHNKPQRAKYYINKINITRLPKKLKAKVLDLKNTLYLRESPKAEITDEDNVSGSLSLAFGYNDNPEYTGSNDATTEASSDGQTDYAAALNYLVSQGSSHDIELSSDISGRSYFEFSNANYASYSLSAQLQSYISKFRIKLQPLVSHEIYGGEGFSNNAGGVFELTRRLGGSYLSAGYSYVDSHILDEDNFFYLEGDTTETYLQWNSSFGQSYLFLTYKWQMNNYADTDDITSSYDAHIVTLSYRYLFTQSNIDFSTTYEMRNYDFDVTEQDSREDNRLYLSFYYSYNLTTDCSLYGGGNFVLNDSNFDETTSDDKNYSQFNTSVGLKYYL